MNQRVPIKLGGTGGDTPVSARTALGLGDAATKSVAELQDATSALVASPKARTIAARALDQEILLTDCAGVIGDGTTDCLVGINNALAAAGGRTLVIPPGTFAFSAPPNPITVAKTQIRGQGRCSILRPTYAAGDILTVGNGTTQTEAITFRDFAIWPSVTKTSGHAVNLRFASRFLSENVFYGSLDDYVLNGNAHRMFDGLYFDRFTECVVSGGQIVGSGHWFKSRGNADGSFGAELEFDDGLRVAYGLGGIVGGGCGGMYFGRMDVSNAAMGVTINNSLQNTPNREAFFGDQCTIDTCTTAGVIIDQALPAAMQVTLAHGWLCSTVAGHGLWIKNANGARILADAKFYNNNGDGMRLSDANAYVEVPSAAWFDLNTGYGINATVVSARLRVKSPAFLANALGAFNRTSQEFIGRVSGNYIDTDADSGFRVVRLTGTSDAGGNLTLAHGLGGDAMAFAMGATAVVRSGGANTAGVFMAPGFIDGTNVNFTTSNAAYGNKPVTVCIFFSAVKNTAWAV